MNTYYAQPYDITANGFWFETAQELADKLETCRNRAGLPVEEFEISFCDGEAMDAALFAALAVDQATISAFIDAVEEWSHTQKTIICIAVGECGHAFTLGQDDPDGIEVDLYPDWTLSDLAAHFIDEGLFGEIPARLASYIDLEAVARDLGYDYTETTIAGARYVYRCA